MKRREFLTKATVVAGLAGSTTLPDSLQADQGAAPGTPRTTAKAPPAQGETRSAAYLTRARQDAFLPKPPVVTQAVRPGDVPISPMPLAERIRRGIVPRHGICSLTPAADALLLSGNGAMSIETACHPYSEQIVFRHESLFAPRKRPFEAPKIAGVFPQVRQLVLDGKYREAARLGYRGVAQDAHALRDGRVWRHVIHDAHRDARLGVRQGLPAHGRLRKHRAEGALDGHAGRVDASGVRVAARQRRGAAAQRARRTAAERPDHHAANRRTRPRHMRQG